ncbi:GTP cyclohydrolase II [Nocardia sp. NPDC004722]
MSSTFVGASVRTSVRIPLTFADGYSTTAQAVTFDGLTDGREHLALLLGGHSLGDPDLESGATPLVRLHSECLTGDVFGSARCDCGPQLREAVERITDAGGILLYLRQEGRDIGLYNKLDAYALQDAGRDTYQANTELGFDEDARDYTAAAQMLSALGVRDIDLLTNNPDKVRQLTELGVAVRDTVPTGVHANPANLRYLRAKADHTGHTIRLVG